MVFHIVSLLVGVACTRARASPDVEDVLVLPFGTVRGNLLPAAREFLGIPYAAPPPRFAPPQPWADDFPGGHLEAREWTPACPQNDDSLRQSEDCLHLNVYTPRLSQNATSAWPVMLYIHGGGLDHDTAMCANYNVSRLVAREDVVLVFINYRLNALGFSPVVLEDGSTIANNGYRDQQEAMRWVRQNIQAFGGDPALITIFGESSGGRSVHAQMVLPGSLGLFDRVITESSDALAYVPLAAGLEYTAAMAKEVGCEGPGDLTCLRRVDYSKLVRAYKQLEGQVVGDDLLPLSPLELMARDDFQPVPTLMNNNVDEGNLFVFPPVQASVPASAEAVRCVFAKRFGAETAQDLLEIYAPTDASGVDNRPIVGELWGDMRMHCGDRRIARTISAVSPDIWMSSFERHASCNLFDVPGAFHTSEVIFVLGNMEDLAGLMSCPPTARDIALGESMGRLWADFARTGKAPWPRYSEAAGEVALRIGLGTLDHMDIATGLRRAQCDALDAAGVAAAPNMSKAVRAELDLCEHELSRGVAELMV